MRGEPRKNWGNGFSSILVPLHVQQHGARSPLSIACCWIIDGQQLTLLVVVTLFAVASKYSMVWGYGWAPTRLLACGSSWPGRGLSCTGQEDRQTVGNAHSHYKNVLLSHPPAVGDLRPAMILAKANTLWVELNLRADEKDKAWSADEALK